MELFLGNDQKADWQYAFRVHTGYGEFIEQKEMYKMHKWARERFGENYGPCFLEGSASFIHAFRFKNESDAAIFVMRWQYANFD